MWHVGAGRTATAVSYGHGATDWGGVAGLVCPALQLINQYHDRPDDAGRFARRLLREMDSLWVFLAQQG